MGMDKPCRSSIAVGLSPAVYDRQQQVSFFAALAATACPDGHAPRQEARWFRSGIISSGGSMAFNPNNERFHAATHPASSGLQLI